MYSGNIYDKLKWDFVRSSTRRTAVLAEGLVVYIHVMVIRVVSTFGRGSHKDNRFYSVDNNVFFSVKKRGLNHIILTLLLSDPVHWSKSIHKPQRLR